ncbi:MAG: carbohydrate ABC transporter permease [Oscillospiraceae bacterium]|jgi:multiple sugar transport system permease protein|nr:carbohydrate ABC transporter permease [Oscillospiraceae bacterium]
MTVGKLRKNTWMVFVYTLLLAGAAASLAPLYWLVRSSFMSLSQIFILPPKWIPSPFRWSNYAKAFSVVPFGRYYLNTALIVAGVVSGTVITSSLSAYAFARLRWRGRNALFACLIASMMLPFAVTMIPLFVGWSRLGFANTYVPLILPAWFGGGAYNIFLLRQFYMTIPRELDESAFVDGAGYVTIYRSILLPLTRPALIVVGMFAFMGCWNDFLGPLIYLSSSSLYTVSLGLRMFQGMYNAEWNLMMAASVVALLPVIVVFFIGQRYIIEGITLTGIKG